MRPHQEQNRGDGVRDGGEAEREESRTAAATAASKINREIGNSAKPERRGPQPVTSLERTQAPSQLQASQSHTPNPSRLDQGIQRYHQNQAPQQQLQLQLPPQLQLVPSPHHQQHQHPRRHLHHQNSSSSSGRGRGSSGSSSSSCSSRFTTNTNSNANTNTYTNTNTNTSINTDNNFTSSTATSTITTTSSGSSNLSPNQSRHTNKTSRLLAVSISPSPPTSSASFSSSTSSSSSSSSSTITPTALSSFSRQLPPPPPPPPPSTPPAFLSPSLASCISPLDPSASTWTQPSVPAPVSVSESVPGVSGGVSSTTAATTTVTTVPFSLSTPHHHDHHHYHHHHDHHSRSHQQHQSPPSANAHAHAHTHVLTHAQPHALTHDHHHYHHQAALFHSPPPSRPPLADDLIISPISETPSSSTLPVFRNLNHHHSEEGLSASAFTPAASLSSSPSSSHGAVPAYAPAPIPIPISIPIPVSVPASSSSISSSYLPPTTTAAAADTSRDPLFGITPLLEEAGFDFEPQSPATDHPDRVADFAFSSAPVATNNSDSSDNNNIAASTSTSTSAALSHAVAHDVAHLTTHDNRSDDWFRYTARNPTISKDNKSSSDQNQTMTVAMAADRVDLPDQQQPPSVGGSSSFTPLPPIRRTSTFDLLRKKGLVADDDSDSAPSPVDQDFPSAAHSSMQGEMAHPNGHSNGQLSADQGQSSPHSAGQQLPHQHHHPQPPSQNSQTQQAYLMQQQPPNGIMAAAAPGQSSASSQQTAFAQMHAQQHQQHQHQHQMFMGRGGPLGPQFPPGPLMNGNPVQRFPPDSRWRLEESHLAEPLNQSHKSRSANNPPPPPQQQQQHQHQQHQQHQQQEQEQEQSNNYSAFDKETEHGQNYHPGTHGQYNDESANGAKGSSEFRSSKDMGVRVDQVSISSVASDDAIEKNRRGSGSLFGLGNRRNTGDQGNPQGPQFGTPEKKRTFFGAVTGHNQSQPKPKSNIGLAKTTGMDRFDVASTHSAGDAVPVKKRLSELKGMIKGVGNAKEGAKEAARDDQAVKFNNPHASHHLMQGSVRGAPAPPGFSVPPGQPGAFGSQRPLGSPGSPPQPGQQGFMVPQRSQASQSPNSQADPMASPPPIGVARVGTGGSLSSQAQQGQNDEGGKRGSGGQRTMQFSPMQSGQPFRPGQMHLPGQPIGPHPMYAGQPQFPQGLSGQLGAQRAVTPDDQLSPGINDPGSPQYVQTAQAVMLRRPSEITVSQPQPGIAQALSPPRSNMPFHQGAQGAMRISPGPSPLGSAHGHPGEVEYDEDAASRDSPRLSEESFQGQLAATSSSAMPRTSPNRKPVGSAPSKQDGLYMTPAQPLARLNEQRPSEQDPLAGASNWQGHTRQPSLPSSTNSPIPSQQSGSPMLQGSGPSTEQQGPTEGLGVSNNAPIQPGISAGPGPQQGTPSWAPNGLRSGPQFANIQPPRLGGSPAPSMDQSKLSKFFGAYDGGKAPANPNASKDKKAASKFFSAFKRSSKQNESNQSQQKRPAPNQQVPPQMTRPGVPGQPAQPGQPSQAGQQAKQPAAASPPGPSSQQPPPQPGMARPLMNGPPPPGPLSAQQQGPMPPRPGHSQSPSQVQAGRDQVSLPAMQGGRGQMSPQQMQALSRAQVPNKVQAPGEPQYDNVPIPRGYEAVHGYGHDRILVSPSPYNIGRPSFPPPQFLQYQPMPRQPVPPQWDPRMMPPPQTGAPYGPGPIPGPVPGPVQAGPQGVMPPPSVQHPPQQPQNQASSQNSSPSLQSVPPHAIHTPPPQQQPIPPQSNSQLNQGSVTEQSNVRSQLAPNPVIGEPQTEPRNGQHRSHSPPAQTPSSSNWGSVPESNNSPASLQRHEPAIRTQITQPNHPGNYTTAPGSGDDSRGLQMQQHIATAINSQHAHPQAPQYEQGQTDLPAPGFGRTLPHVQGDGSPKLHSPNAGASKGESDVTRLTSRMSVSNEPPRSESLSPHVIADRAMSVSPEPSSQRQQAPVHHQVSETSMNVDVERANEFKKDAEDDIYDATPRLNSSHLRDNEDQDHMQENTKYAGSEKGRVMMVNGVVVPGGAGSRSTSSFLSGPEDSDTEGDVAPEVAIHGSHVEPEEKILVDQPVELAAVNDDDDDGMPMMSATSYPGQEWNPYGAGEFGDWD
ncbi:hypothetical protein F4775DRAFT_114409 [Biscogniauxia sp. FL1348]|nr:hypothetical protein F4775DRAFT_114409 [Biscogniauxia sp. FL1348]